MDGGRILSRRKGCNIVGLPKDNTSIFELLPAGRYSPPLRGSKHKSLVEMFRVPELEGLMVSSTEWSRSQPVIGVCMQGGFGDTHTASCPPLCALVLCYDASMAFKLLPDLEELSLELPRPTTLVVRRRPMSRRTSPPSSPYRVMSAPELVINFYEVGLLVLAFE